MRFTLKKHRKTWSVTGGIHPPQNKAQSTTQPIVNAPLPKELVLSLRQHAGLMAEPIVAVGDRVLKGEKIARPASYVSAALHAPSSGTVTAIEPRLVAHPSGLMEPCIVIQTDGIEQWSMLHPSPDFIRLSPEALTQRIRDAGISGLGGAGFPTAVKLKSATPIHTLIINGTECEPYITADDMLMRERASAILLGAEILQYILGATNCLIGIENNKPEAIAAMSAALSKRGHEHQHGDMEIVVFPTVYPSGGERQLIQILTGQEVPSGKLPADLGIVVQNVGTVAAVKEAIIDGIPLISRVTTLTGDALQQPRNVDVLLGTSIASLLYDAGLSRSRHHMTIVGGPMMGFEMMRLEVPITKTVNCVIAATEEEFPPLPLEQPCIRCGHCAEVCPASLLPQQLYWHSRAENHDQLQNYNLFDCIECGACAYVCPSAIPLVQYYRASKGTIRQLSEKQSKAEHSKARYERRLQRIEQEKADKEAKRKANLARAAELKAAKEAGGAAEAVLDPIQAAIARAKAKKTAAANSSDNAVTEKSAAQSSSTATVEPVYSELLNPRQKKIKTQLSVGQAQLRKTEQALARAEALGSDNVDQLKANLQLLQNQVDRLQQKFDEGLGSDSDDADHGAEVAAVDDNVQVAAEEKKRKIALAMVHANAKKLQRALDKASDDERKTLQQQSAEAQQKLVELEGGESSNVKPAAVEEAVITKAAPSAPQAETVAPPKPKAKPSLTADEKRLRVELAMANATVKKLQRALANAADHEQVALKTQLSEAQKRLEQAQQQLD